MPTTDLMDSLFVDSVTFIPQWRQELSRQAGGSPRVADLGAELWTAKIGCSVMRDSEALKAEAFINRLRGSIDTFYVWNPKAQYPQADQNGAVIGSNVVRILELGDDNKSLSLEGLTAGYAITIGDFMAFDDGASPPHRCLHQFVASAVADDAGLTSLIEVTPHIRAGATAGLVVSLKRPAAEMMILPGSYDAPSTRPRFTSLSFTAVQVP